MPRSGHTLWRWRSNPIIFRRRWVYVVVSNVLSPELVEAVLNEILTSDNLLGKFDRTDPESWNHPSWPQQANGGRNFLSSTNVFGDGCNWDVASSPRQYHLQKLLWQRDNLIMSSLGRWGVMRPSGYNSQWKTESNWLHWDHNHGQSLDLVMYRQSFAWPTLRRPAGDSHVYQDFIKSSSIGAKHRIIGCEWQDNQRNVWRWTALSGAIWWSLPTGDNSSISPCRLHDTLGLSTAASECTK